MCTPTGTAALTSSSCGGPPARARGSHAPYDQRQANRATVGRPLEILRRPRPQIICAEGGDAVHTERFVARLASALIGTTFNFYRDGEGAAERRRRLRVYLEERASVTLLLVGEAAGYRGARVSGIPFTSERQLSGTGPAEATATIVQRVLRELELEALCWNVVPTHPGTESSNRAPTMEEVRASRPFLDELAEGRRLVAVGRLAERVTGAPYVRHPAPGGGAEFRAGLLAFAAGGRPSPLFVRPSQAEAWHGRKVK